MGFSKRGSGDRDCDATHSGSGTILRHFAALTDGRTEYLIPKVTGHVQSNLWLVEKILGAKTLLKGNHLSIDGIGLSPLSS